MKRNVIMTSSDSKFGDFLIDHFLKSIEKNVTLLDTDIVIFDYGLTTGQKERLKGKNVKVVKCNRDGHVVIIRFRDMLNFLKRHKYKQILSCDGGDIIFQNDIVHLFYKDEDKFRAGCEEKGFPFNELLIKFQKSIDPSRIDEIKRTIKNKKGINGGVIIAPREKFMRFCKMCNDLIIDKSKYGPDQLILNYLLYKEGFARLPRTYNYFLYAVDDVFEIKDGKFYDGTNNLVYIVHNSGTNSFMRAIKNFGYGIGFNKVKYIRYYLVRIFLKISNWIYPLSHQYE